MSGIYYFQKSSIHKWLISIFNLTVIIAFMEMVLRSETEKAQKIVNQIFSGVKYGLLFCLLCIFIFGRFSNEIDGSRYSFGNITPSVIAFIACTCIFLFLPKLFEKKKLFLTKEFYFILFAFCILLISFSKSGIILSILLTGFYLYKIRRLFVEFLVLISIGIIPLMFSSFFIVQYGKIIEMMISDNNLFTLHGRVFIWTEILDLIKENYWFGFGYGSPSAILKYPYINIWEGRDIIQAHNAWLQSLINVGVIGTIPLLIVFVLVIYRAIRVYTVNRFQNMYFIGSLLCVLLYLLFRGFTEASFTMANSFEQFVFICCVFSLNLFTRSEKEQS